METFEEQTQETDVPNMSSAEQLLEDINGVPPEEIPAETRRLIQEKASALREIIDDPHYPSDKTPIQAMWLKLNEVVKQIRGDADASE